MNLGDLQKRRDLDLRVLTEMRCESFQFEAYSTITDLSQGQRPVAGPHGTSASKYRFMFNIPTPTGPASFSSATEIGVDSDVPDYPHQPPRTWVLSRNVPWSPYFMAGAPVYIDPGQWLVRGDNNTLGHLALHICLLLNWDWRQAGPGYADWNAAAIDHRRSAYGDRPINADLSYPMLPAWLGATAPLHHRFQINVPALGRSADLRRHPSEPT